MPSKPSLDFKQSSSKPKDLVGIPWRAALAPRERSVVERGAHTKGARRVRAEPGSARGQAGLVICGDAHDMMGVRVESGYPTPRKYATAMGRCRSLPVLSPRRAALATARTAARAPWCGKSRNAEPARENAAARVCQLSVNRRFRSARLGERPAPAAKTNRKLTHPSGPESRHTNLTLDAWDANLDDIRRGV